MRPGNLPRLLSSKECATPECGAPAGDEVRRRTEDSSVMIKISRTLVVLGATALVGTAVVGALGATSPAPVQGMQSGRFAGPKANTGTVSHARQGMNHVLTLSADFTVPDTPDPHWQIVDSKGTTYLLDRLPLKGDRVARSIVVPAYVPDVQKVVIWCAFAEANLGEARFGTPLKLK
jgi:hypothetical protein